MGIKEDFLSYTKWGATKFTDFFHILLLNLTGDDGIAWHLQEIRQKTYDAIAALVDLCGTKVDKTSLTSTGESNKPPVLDADGALLTSFRNFVGYSKKYSGLNLGFTSTSTFSLILLTPTVVGLVNMSKIKGIFHLNRGNSVSGNYNLFVDIDIQTAYNQIKINKFDSNLPEATLVTCLYKGVSYYAIAIKGSLSAYQLLFEGLWKTIDTVVTIPKLIDNYLTNTDITNVVDLDLSSLVTEGMMKQVVGGIKSFLVTFQTLIKKSSTGALDVQNDAGTTSFRVDTVNDLVGKSTLVETGTLVANEYTQLSEVRGITQFFLEIGVSKIHFQAFSSLNSGTRWYCDCFGGNVVKVSDMNYQYIDSGRTIDINFTISNNNIRIKSNTASSYKLKRQVKMVAA